MAFYVRFTAMFAYEYRGMPTGLPTNDFKDD